MRAQSGKTGKAGSVKRLTSEKAMGKVSKATAAKKSLYNAKGQLKERPKKRGR